VAETINDKEIEMDLNENTTADTSEDLTVAQDAVTQDDLDAPSETPDQVVTEAVTEAVDAADVSEEDEASSTRSDEGVLDKMVEEKFPHFNKVSRNRFGNGKVLMIASSRNVQSNQRKIEVEVPADGIKWASGADLETHLLILARDAGGHHRVITADITEHLDELKAGRVRFTLNRWDDYGNPDNVSAVIGTARAPIEIDEFKIEDWSQE
jgi:hypothetical protein